MKKEKKILIEIVTAQGCSKCQRGTEKIRNQLKNIPEINIKEINLIENPEIAVKYKIMTTPVLIINNKLEFTGVPDEKELKKVIEKYR